jgi:hypothetical protein
MNKVDGFARIPSAALHCIFGHCDPSQADRVPQDLRALHLEAFCFAVCFRTFYKAFDD